MNRIIDFKKVDITDSEWQMYQDICKAYDEPNRPGKGLFAGLFETDGNGIIIFLRPPTNYVSMEIYLFLVSIFVHQHIRNAYSRFDEVKEFEKALFQRLKEKEQKLDELIAKFEQTKKE